VRAVSLSVRALAQLRASDAAVVQPKKKKIGCATAFSACGRDRTRPDAKWYHMLLMSGVSGRFRPSGGVLLRCCGQQFVHTVKYGWGHCEEIFRHQCVQSGLQKTTCVLQALRSSDQHMFRSHAHGHLAHASLCHVPSAGLAQQTLEVDALRVRQDSQLIFFSPFMSD
jgi:hypothetical protein